MVWKTLRLVTGMGLFVLSLCALAAEPPVATERVSFKIDAPTMVAALIQFTQQSGLQLMFPSSEADQIIAPRVEGNLTARAALEQLLQDSGLTYEFVNAHTVFIKTQASPQRAAAQDKQTVETTVR